jgi:dihydrofolate reductase
MGEMARIIVSNNVTLDGVVQDPTEEEGFRQGGWFARVGPDDREGFAGAALDEALRAEAFLMGRRTYEFLASRWPTRNGPLADRLRSLPKYVVSSTLNGPEWDNTTILKGDAVRDVSELKQQLDGEIVVPASRQLVQTLIARELVDEFRLLVYPFVLGAGDRLFGESTVSLPLRLVDNRTVGDNLAYVVYEVVRTA